MINLVPPEQKRQIRAAQTNVLLFRYCIASLFLAFSLASLVAIAYITMNNSKSTAEQALRDGQVKSAQYADVQKSATEFTNNLAIAKTVLDKEVKYTNVAIKIAQTLPSGIVLNSLQLDAESFGKPMTLDAKGKSYNDALRLKTAFEQSSDFSDPHLLSVSKSDTDGDYPFAISISVIIKPEISKS